MANLYQQSLCRHSSRGCDRVLTPITTLSHLQECAFAPVQCSHEGCQATVNRQDLVSHHQACEFRSVTCDDCRETMRQREYGNHNCVLRRELTEVTRMLRDMQARQLGRQTSEATQITAAMRQRRNNVRGELLQFEATQVQQVVTQRLGGEFMEQHNATRRQQGHFRELTGPSMSFDVFGGALSVSSATQSQATVNKQIVVAGGTSDKSYEVFNWSTQQWTLLEDALFFCHTDGFSFVYDNKMMICGGTATNRVECLNIPNISSVCTFPTQLPGTDCGKGVLCGDKILTFGKSVSASSLKPPFKTTVLATYTEGWKLPGGFGIARFNENTVILVGGCNSSAYSVDLKDIVFKYNTRTKQIEELAPLPYKLCGMAVVVHNDDVIILGGRKEYVNNICSDVLMYNVANQQCSKLPSMLQKRSNCAAAIIGDSVIVMGGRSTSETGHVTGIKTAEYLVLGENSWKELPPMHCVRAGATACAVP